MKKIKIIKTILLSIFLLYAFFYDSYIECNDILAWRVNTLTLSACPFCGSFNVSYYQSWNTSWYIGCNECAASSSVYSIDPKTGNFHIYTKEEAREIWEHLKRY